MLMYIQSRSKKPKHNNVFDIETIICMHIIKIKIRICKSHTFGEDPDRVV